MDQSNVAQHEGEATPIFGAYRRGYDPEQVDRYVAEQQRRLDSTIERASEAERKLAAAVGQLRELHRRVAVLESEDRSPQPAPLDTLGERVQRILQEAWEGAYALRQATEQDVAELKERTAGEAEATIMEARQRARAIEDEIERRRGAYLERVEEDRARAVAQITHLHHQRDVAVGELLKVKAVIEATVGEVSAPRRASAGDAESTSPKPRVQTSIAATPPNLDLDLDLAPTMAVHRIETTTDVVSPPSPSELVRSHREGRPSETGRSAGASRPSARQRPVDTPLDTAQPAPSVFDFEDDQER